MRGNAARQRTTVRLGLLTLADAETVVGLRPSARLGTDRTAPHAWLARVGADVAVTELAAAALWLAACWLAVGLVASGVAAMPGAGGRAGRRLAAAVLPRAVYRRSRGRPGSASSCRPLRPARSGRRRRRRPRLPPGPHPTPSLRRAGRPARCSRRRTTHSRITHSRTTHRRNNRAQPASASQVVVAPGESLWSIAADHLHRPSPQRVAAAWPRWYAANRAVIGTDPNHIAAGEVLDPPTHHQEGTS